MKKLFLMTSIAFLLSSCSTGSTEGTATEATDSVQVAVDTVQVADSASVDTTK